MSRSGYVEVDEMDDHRQMAMWRDQVASAIRGKRGQRLLRDLLSALDAMPQKRLIAYDLVSDDGEVCALGALGKARGMDLSGIEPEDPTEVATAFDIAEQLAREIVWWNDDAGSWSDTPEKRWTRVRAWVAEQVKA